MPPKTIQLPPAIRRSLRRLGDDLATWRRLRGLTQSQLADRADLSVDTIKRLEGGDGGVSTANLMRVLRSLGILESFGRALDPYESDIGRLRSEETLPQRVRGPRPDRSRDDG